MCLIWANQFQLIRVWKTFVSLKVVQNIDCWCPCKMQQLSLKKSKCFSRIFSHDKGGMSSQVPLWRAEPHWHQEHFIIYHIEIILSDEPAFLSWWENLVLASCWSCMSDIKDVIWLTRYRDILHHLVTCVSLLGTSWPEGYWLYSCMHQTGSLTIIGVLFWLNRKTMGPSV